MLHLKHWYIIKRSVASEITLNCINKSFELFCNTNKLFRLPQIKKKTKDIFFCLYCHFYEVDKHYFYSEALICMFIEKSNAFLLFSHLLLTNLNKNKCTWT